MVKKKTKSKAAHEQIYTLRIFLPQTNPLVWRRVMVPEYYTLEKLHSILQMVLGWQFSHQYDFVIAGKRYAEPSDFDDKPTGSVASSIQAALRDCTTLTYNYDFGDSWEHMIEVESVAPPKSRYNYPICIGGENACPPEDCGGIPGYEDLKEKIKKTTHPEHEETMQWLGGFFDPASFDPNRINRDMLWMVDWSKEPNDQGLYLPFNSEDFDSRREEGLQ